MSYEIFPVPFVNQLDYVVNRFFDGLFYVSLEPLTRLLSTTHALPPPTRWEMLSQAGPQRRVLQDMTAAETFFQSCYILVRAGIKWCACLLIS